MKGYYTIPEIANMMEVSYTTVYSWKDKGILVPDKITPSNVFSVRKKFIILLIL